jgi:hypothetical protein
MPRERDGQRAELDASETRSKKNEARPSIDHGARTQERTWRPGAGCGESCYLPAHVLIMFLNRAPR